MQPDPAMLRQLYEEEVTRKKLEYGASDSRIAQAARDFGLFLSKHGDAAAAQKVLADVVRLDEAACGADAKQTLADVAARAAVSPPRRGEPVWRGSVARPARGGAGGARRATGPVRE